GANPLDSMLRGVNSNGEDPDSKSFDVSEGTSPVFSGFPKGRPNPWAPTCESPRQRAVPNNRRHPKPDNDLILIPELFFLFCLPVHWLSCFRP
ncbi:MAG: hypothetical protein VX694_13990, partial [Planctomycetota bacterium]|nr:hypothetical protein [Planctomycetota bacterium]